MLKKIVIIGPESTGKSTLSAQLASHYNTVWCPEFAREFLLKHGMNYTYDDLLTIAKGQLALEDEYAQKVNDGFFFIDTDLYVMKVWCEVAFGKCHSFILKQIVERKYDFYLLCQTDLPWVKDELREYPDLKMRQRLFNMYLDLLSNQPTPWSIVDGTEEQRFQKAVDLVNSRVVVSNG